MKLKRYKKAERYMSLYKNHFGFREPYQVLLDGTFCQVALAHKVNIQDQLPRYLSGECKLLTTACVVEETKRLGKPLHGAYLVVSQFPVHNCGHEKPISASKCLYSFISETKNSDHYLLASQDHTLRSRLAKEIVCPLVKLANNALVMEKPTPKVKDKVNRRNHYFANKMNDEERSDLQRLKGEENLLEQPQNKIEKKKRKQRGPNPLSCKKKTKVSSQKKNNEKSNSSDETKTTKRRRGKRSHIPRHVKKLLTEQITCEGS